MSKEFLLREIKKAHASSRKSSVSKKKKVVKVKKKAEEELRESEEKLRNIIENTYEVFFIHDTKHNIKYVSPKCKEIFGYSEKEMIRKWNTLTTDNPINNIGLESTAKAIRTGKKQDPFLLEVKRKDGKKAIIEVNESPIKDSSGKVIAITGSGRDVTEQNKIKEALKESEQKYRHLFDDSIDLLIALDNSMNITDVNKKMVKLIGYSKEEVIGQSARKFIVPEYLPMISKSLKRDFEGKHTPPLEIELLTKKGKKIPIEFTEGAIHLYEKGKIVGIVASARDIIERKKVEEEIIESKKKYLRLVENLDDMLYSTDKNGVINYMSPQVEKYGYKPKEVISKRILDFVLPEDRKRVAADYQKSIKTGSEFPTIFRIKDRKGDIHWIEDNGNVLRDESGIIIGVSSILRDITKQKKAEKELKESEEKLRTIVDHSDEMFYLHDTKHKLTYVSQQSKKIFGYSPEEMMIKWMTLATDNLINEEGIRITNKAIKTGIRQPVYLLELKKKNGQRFFAEINESPIKDENGKVVGISGALKDITERKKAEEEIKEIKEYLELQVARMPIGLIVWDSKFRVTTWNPEAEKIFGFKKKEALGKHPYDIIVPKSAQPMVDKIWIRLLKGDETAHSVNDNLTKDGRTITCSWANTPLKKPDGTIIGVLSMVRDITEQKKAEEEVKKRKEELERWNRLAVGRELKMIELKKEIERLKK